MIYRSWWQTTKRAFSAAGDKATSLSRFRHSWGGFGCTLNYCLGHISDSFPTVKVFPLKQTQKNRRQLNQHSNECAFRHIVSSLSAAIRTGCSPLRPWAGAPQAALFRHHFRGASDKCPIVEARRRRSKTSASSSGRGGRLTFLKGGCVWLEYICKFWLLSTLRFSEHLLKITNLFGVSGV